MVIRSEAVWFPVKKQQEIALGLSFLTFSVPGYCFNSTQLKLQPKRSLVTGGSSACWPSRCSWGSTTAMSAGDIAPGGLDAVVAVVADAAVPEGDAARATAAAAAAARAADLFGLLIFSCGPMGLMILRRALLAAWALVLGADFVTGFGLAFGPAVFVLELALDFVLLFFFKRSAKALLLRSTQSWSTSSPSWRTTERGDGESRVGVVGIE